MAITQTSSRRIREAINKKIQRQLDAGLTPLTTFKTYFPFEAGGDIIDRRTGKVKTINQFVAERVRESKGEVTPQMAKDAFHSRISILAALTELTNTKQVVKHWGTIADEVGTRYMDAMWAKYGSESEPVYDEKTGEVVETNPYLIAKEKLEKMTERQRIQFFSQAGGKVNASKHSVSYFHTISEMLGVDDPDLDTPKLT